jgi:hypothetical protein
MRAAMIWHSIKGHKAAMLLIAASLVMIADRAAWASVSQWREDQALSIWLGAHIFRQPTPVGLINSLGIPNPNGIALVGFFLSLLPGLFAVSLVLGCLTALAALLAICPGTNRLRRMWPVLFVLWASVHLRGLGAELWGQWLMIPLNLLFVATALAYVRRPRLVQWAAVSILIFAAPAIYLAGLVNSAAFSAVWIAIVVYERRRSRATTPFRWIPIAAVVLSIGATAALVTWIPYFRAISVQALTQSVGLPLGQRLTEAATALVFLPGTLGDLLQCGFAPLLQGDSIVRPAAFGLVRVAGLTALLQVLVAAFALLLLLRRTKAERSVLEGCAIAGLLIVLSFPLSPLLGGFSWHRGERLDQSIQFLPLLLLIIFAAPLAMESSLLRRLTIALALLFATASTLAGWMVVQDHLRYRGPILSQADVPLVQKMEVVNWIAADWRAQSASRSVPVAYDLIGIWRFLPAHGRLTSRWYPGQLSVGRAFDYELLRRHNLGNAFEGQTDRPNQQARYVVSYAFMPRPQYVVEGSEERFFGRLRVSVQSGGK